MKNSLIIIFILILIFRISTVVAQQTVGIRGGGLCNISYRSFVDTDQAVEISLNDRYNGFHITMLSMKFKPLSIPWAEDVKLYTGFGAHAGFASSGRYDDYYDVHGDNRWGPLAGADFIIGAEYQFNSLPIIVGVDYNPFAEFSVARTFSLNAWNFGATVRYCIN